MNRFAPLLLVASASACDDGVESRLTRYAHGAPWSQGEVVDGRAHGVWRTFHPDGSLASEGEYVRGLEHGRWAEYADDGTTLGFRNYEEGRLVGPWLRCYPDGTPESSGTFVDGLREGEWIDYYEDGAPRSRGAYRAGRRDGVWEQLARDGTLLASQTFSGDVADGPFARFTSEGVLIAFGRYAEGEPEGVWWTFRPDGSVDTRAERRSDGSIAVTGYLPSGAAAYSGTLQDDQRVGEWRFWGADGSIDPDLSGLFAAGSRVGPLGADDAGERPTAPEPGELPIPRYRAPEPGR